MIFFKKGDPYKIDRNDQGLKPFVKFLVLPLTIFSILLISLGIYTFTNANRIMRGESKAMEEFANNILPSYSIASFKSLDGLTSISGWLFPSKTKAISTVVMVHGNGRNRLEYDAATVDIYEFFISRGYNVFSFDLRHSGNSAGTLSTFGYSEWEDVVSAIAYVRRATTTKNVLLYGFDSGVTASLIASTKLIEPGQSPDDVPKVIADLEFDQSYIKGMILDSPLVSSDDYIRYVCQEKVFAGKIIGQFTIPYAIRLSAKSEQKFNLASILARTQVPVHLLFQKHPSDFLNDRGMALINERTRLFPNQTSVYIRNEKSSSDPFIYDEKNYLDSIDAYLKRFISIS